MKIAKSFLAGFFGLALLGACCVGAQAKPAAQSAKLQYSSSGKFKILEFTDVHEHYTAQPETYTFMGEAIDYARPDLVVIDGDLVWGDASAQESEKEEMAAIKRVAAPMVQRGVPFAIVFGNHDQEYRPGGKDSRAEQMKLWQSIPGCLAWDDNPKSPGCSTFYLPVYSSQDSAKMVQTLWFFDSGANADGGYDWVRRDQIDWYIGKSRQLQAQNGGKIVPAVAFQHIIVPEIYEYFRKAPANLSLGKATGTFLGVNRLMIPDFTKINGTVLEPPCPPRYTDGEFAAWVARGDIFAAVFGHDHMNNFVAPMQGIDLIQTPSTGFFAYGTDIYRGATLITLTESSPRSYQKELLTYRKLAALPGSQIGQTRAPDDKMYHRALVALEEAIQLATFAVK